MQQTKLIDLFKALKPEEFREFAKFLKSPFYNNNDRVIKLYEYLRKNVEALDSPKLDKAYVFKRMFPKGEAFADWKIRELRSELTQLLEEFFIVKEAQLNQIDHKMLLIESLRKRGADKYFFRYANKMEEEMRQKTPKNMEHYLALLKLQHELYYHPDTSKITNKGSRELLQGILIHTDMYYSLARLRYGYEIAAWEQVRGEKLTGIIPNEVLEALPEDFISQNLLLELYAKTTQIYKTQDKALYQVAKAQIFKNIDRFSQAEATNFITFLINASRFAVPTPQRLTEVLELYQKGLQHRLFLAENKFPLDHFNNIVVIGCSLNKYDWVQDFINQYYTYLPKEGEREENIQRLYEAYLAFTQKDHNQVETLLHNLEFDDVSYGLRHYTLLISSLYELKKIEVYDKCSAFSVYLHRKNKSHFISSNIHAEHTGFIKMVKLLADNRGQFKTDRQHLKTKLDQLGNIALKRWIDEKIAEI